jgi:hypothetical protein
MQQVMKCATDKLDSFYMELIFGIFNRNLRGVLCGMPKEKFILKYHQCQ